MSKIKVRFLVDKEQKRVAFAEAGSDFVDVLFSFLTLPLGSIVRLFNKQSGLGCLDSLYESVEKLDANLLQTEACKEMLLSPRSAAAIPCEDLKIKNIHDLKPRSFFSCKENGCLVQSTSYYAYTTKCRCNSCGKLMDQKWVWNKGTTDEEGIFVNGNVEFMITDDLRLMPTSLMNGCSILNEMQIRNPRSLEERVIEFGTEEALNLLRRSLISKNALTEVCFPDACVLASSRFSLPIKEEKVFNNSEEEIILKLLIDKESNNVICAEVGKDFINQLVSFLTIPLGSVLRFLPDNIALVGCISNLYSSAETIGLDCFKSEVCRNMLLVPKLSTFYGIKNQILELEEISSEKLTVEKGCIKCYSDNGNEPCASSPCIHGIKDAEEIEQNPKSRGEADTDRDFVVGSRKFMVADDLHVSSLSFISAVGNGLMDSSGFDLITKEVQMNKSKARQLLGAMLTSKSVLTTVFSPMPHQMRKS